METAPIGCATAPVIRGPVDHWGLQTLLFRRASRAAGSTSWIQSSPLRFTLQRLKGSGGGLVSRVIFRSVCIRDIFACGVPRRFPQNYYAFAGLVGNSSGRLT